jgi:hypothetical protein
VACYASRKFLPAETRWSTFQQEASTVVWALERFHEFTQGYHVLVETDHRNISFVKRSSMPQLARWRMRLQDHDFSIRYLSGPRNLTSDGLSRQHVDDVEVSLHDVVPECALDGSGVANNAVYAEIAALCTARYVDTDLANIAPFDVEAPEPANDALTDDSSSTSASDSDNDEQEVDADAAIDAEAVANAIPIIDHTAVLRDMHNDLVGHAGVYTTLQRVLRNGRAWGSRTQMLADVDAFIKACVCCQKMRKRRPLSLTERHTISGSPFSELSIDILKLPNADALGNKYVVVIVDSFSHWTSLVAVRNKSAFDAARALMHVIGNFGAPLKLRSDGGQEFLGAVIVGVSRLMGVSKHVVVPYTPQANGIVERANRAVLERLREMIFSKRLVRHTHHQWSDLLPLVQRAINASDHSAIGTTPARILFGDSIDLDRCLLSEMPADRDLDVNDYVDALTFNQRIILEEANRHQIEICKRAVDKARRNQRVKRGSVYVDAPVKAVAVDDWVLVKPHESYPLNKLAPRWLGPFRVLEAVDGQEVVKVFDTLKHKVRSFFRRDLELFDKTFLSDVEGLKTVAETDGFEFPVDCICGHALINANGVGADPVQLPASFVRGSRARRQLQFLVRWTGYEEPTWMAYKDACRLVQFPGYVALFPGLAMT